MTAPPLLAQEGAPVPKGNGRALRRALRRSQRRQSASALLLVLPLLLTVDIFFAAPIVGLLSGAVHSPEYSDGFPASARHMQESGTFDEAFYSALFDDLKAADAAQTGGAVARRLN